MISFLIAALGLIFIAIGLLLVLSSVMPKFGDGSDPFALPIGFALLALGIVLLFKAGTVA